LYTEIAKVIGLTAIVSVSTVLITLGALRWFGQKWFEHQFAQRLEQFRRQQSELLEHYRYQINSQFNRITKIHEKEFEVLPEIWQRVQDSYLHFVSLASPFQQWPPLDSYTREQVEAFLDDCELLDFQKDELREAQDKLEYYRKVAYWIRLSNAREKFSEFRTYLRYNKIFLSRDLFELFREIELAMIDTEVHLEDPEDGLWSKTSAIYQNLTKDVNHLLEKVEDAVQERLHFNRA